jgi:hypothetical protein
MEAITEATTKKRKRTPVNLVIVGITNMSSLSQSLSNEMVVTPLQDACSYIFKDGSTIDPTAFKEEGDHVVVTKVINHDEYRPFVTHCRGNIRLDDNEKVPKTPQLFINTYNSRGHNPNLPRRKPIQSLQGRVVGFINLFTNERPDALKEEIEDTH